MDPAIGHAKQIVPEICLKGEDGDALHAVLCAAGCNIRWLLRAIARMGLKAHLLRRDPLKWLVELSGQMAGYVPWRLGGSPMWSGK